MTVNYDGPLRYIGDEKLSSLNTAAGFDEDNYDGADFAYITISGGVVRWRDGGNSPDASTGHIVDGTNSEKTIWYTGGIAGLEFIKTSGTPVIFATFYSQ